MIHFIPANFLKGSFSFSIYSAFKYSLFHFYKLLLPGLLLIIIWNPTAGANVGDYKSNASSFNWISSSNWLVCSTAGNPGLWSTATNYPGQSTLTGNVLIVDGQTVNLNGAIVPNAIGSLTIGTTTAGDGGLSFTSNNPCSLNVTGDITINGGNILIESNTTAILHTLAVGGNITLKSGSFNMKSNFPGCQLILNGTSNQTISGTGGNYYFYDLLIRNTKGVLLNYKADLMRNLTVDNNCIFDISTAIFNKTSSPDTNIKLNSGSIFRLSGTTGGTGGSTGSNFPVRTGGGLFSYTIDAGSTVEYYGVDQTISQTVAYSNLTLSGSGVKTITGITVNGIFSLEGTATTTGTAPTYGIGATLQYKGSTAQKTGIELPVAFSGSGGVIFTNTAGVTLGSSIKVNGATQITPASSRLIIPPATCLNTTTIASTTDPNQILIQTSPTGTGGNGSLIFNNVGAVYGTVEMFSKAAYDGTHYKWQFFGIPLHNLAAASPTFDGGYVRKMNESDFPSHWEQLTNTSGLAPFIGYEITQFNSKPYVFQGQLENKDYPVTTLPFTTTGVTYPGQSLIGNPYTAAIEISKIVFGNKMFKTVYIYNTGSFADWNIKKGVEQIDSATTISPGQYTAIPFALAGKFGLQHQIPSMQAFLVKAMSKDATATLSIPYSSVVADSVPQRSKKQLSISTSEESCTIINVKGSRFSDRMWLFTEPNCTHSFDNGWDGEKFLGSGLAPQIYAMEADGDYQVNSVDDINNTYLGFQAGEDSLYTLTFTHQNLELKYGNIYLVDSVGQQTVDITLDGSKYEFRSLPTDSIIKRFKIITSPDISTKVTTPTLAITQLNLFSSNHTVYIDNKSDETGSLYLYDMTGRFIQKYNFAAHGVSSFQTNVTPGTYLVKGITKNRSVTKNISL